MLCLPCALEGGPLQRAVIVQGGTSMCARHRRPTPGEAAKRPGHRRACDVCRRSGREHVAWFMLDAAPLCIRHAAEAVHPDDDMRAHDMAHSLYLQLQAQGVPNRY